MAKARDEQLAATEVQACVLKRNDGNAAQHAGAGESTVKDCVLTSTFLPPETAARGLVPPPKVSGSGDRRIDCSSCTQCHASVATVHVVLVSCLLGATMVRAV